MEWTQQRLDALAETVELLVALHRDNEERLKEVMVMSTRLGNIIAAHDQTIDSHESRITDLEDQ